MQPKNILAKNEATINIPSMSSPPPCFKNQKKENPRWIRIKGLQYTQKRFKTIVKKWHKKLDISNKPQQKYLAPGKGGGEQLLANHKMDHNLQLDQANLSVKTEKKAQKIWLNEPTNNDSKS